MNGGLNSFESIEERNFTGLTGKTIRFSEFLRCRGFKVSPDGTRDAVSSLLEIDPFIREDFFAALRTNLAKTDGEWHQFADRFHEFWDGEPDEPRPPSDPEACEAPVDQPAACETEIQAAIGEPSPAAVAGRDGKDHHPSYSPLPAAEKQFTTCFDKADIPLAGRAIKTVLTPFRPFESRRSKRTRKAADIDFAFVMRRSLKYEGLPLELHYKKRKKKLRRAVFLIDVSGSMDRHARMVLPVILSLKIAGSRPEIFVFSTALVKITSHVRRMQTGQVLDAVCRLVPDWSGGTRIGQSLHELNHSQGRQLLSRRTVVIMLSDGWDLGDKELLRHEMMNLRRKVNRIIWLNPLAGDPAYEPLCQGMKTALPYIDYFLPADTMESLTRAAHLMARVLSR